MFYRRHVWTRIPRLFGAVTRRPFCTGSKPTAAVPNTNSVKADGSSLSSYDAYKDLDKLDFMTAAKILFTTPPKKKKFGIDFHLVQLVFACMPSLAVYLVAQYARYEMRRMEAELELKKQAEEEARAKEMEELKATEEKEAATHPELLDVKVRLEKLEETLKEIKKNTEKSNSKNREEEKQSSDQTDRIGDGKTSVNGSQKGTQEGSSCQDAKK